MVLVQLLEQLQAGQLAGVLLLELEAGQHLVPDALQRIFGEARLADHLAEQLQRRLALVRRAQAAQAGDGHVAVGAVAEIGAQAFEAFGDGGDVLALDAFVEHGVGQHGQAGRAAILAAAGGEGQAQVEHRQFMGFDEEHLGATFGLPALDVQLAPWQGLVVQFVERFQAGFVLRLGNGLAGFGRCGDILRGRDGSDRLAGLAVAGGQAESAEQGQAVQAATQQVAITHRRTPRAEHGQRSGASG